MRSPAPPAFSASFQRRWSLLHCRRRAQRGCWWLAALSAFAACGLSFIQPCRGLPGSHSTSSRREGGSRERRDVSQFQQDLRTELELPATLAAAVPPETIADGEPPSTVEEGDPVASVLRWLLAGSAACAVLAPSFCDIGLAVAWAAFDSIPFTHDKMFEAYLSVAAFALIIIIFESLHFWLPDARSYRLDGQPPHRALYSLHQDIVDKTVLPILAYLAGIALFHQIGLGQILFGVKPEIFAAPSFVRVVVEVCLGVFLYDLLFYPIHYSLHNLPVRAWRDLHVRHHSWARRQSASHNASETVYHSLEDGSLQVAVNILVQNVSPWGFKHPLSRAIHNVLVIYLLCEAHSGYDLPFMSHRVFPGIFGGPQRHEAHHQSGSICYHQFFTYIDDAIGRGLPSAPSDAPKERVV